MRLCRTLRGFLHSAELIPGFMEVRQMKVVINVCYGGFGLSDFAMKELGYTSESEYDTYRDVDRADPRLVALIEEYGDAICSGPHAKLKIVEVPDDVKWHVEEYDGWEHVAENHRTWG